jgi:hypothetical protein
MLSHPLGIFALVGRYPASKLIPRKPLPGRNLTICSLEVIRYYPQFPAAIPVPGARDLRLTTPFAAVPLPKEGSRSTCMPNPRRQRSF